MHTLRQAITLDAPCDDIQLKKRKYVTRRMTRQAFTCMSALWATNQSAERAPLSSDDVASDIYQSRCPPPHPTHFEPYFIELNDIL